MRFKITEKLNDDQKAALKASLIFHLIVITFGLIVAYINHVDLFTYNFNWDSAAYREIINHFYIGASSDAIHSAVFYPLFPLAIKFLQLITFNSIPLSILGAIFNFCCVTFAIYFLRRIMKILFSHQPNLPTLATILLLTFHSAFFLHCFYTEALLLALGLGAYYYALKRRWGIMAALLAFTTAVRLPGLLFVGLCGLEFLRAYDYKPQKFFNKNLCWFILAPAGLILYMLFLGVTRGDPLAMFHAYQGSDWESYQIFNPNIFSVYIKYIQNFLHFLLHHDFKTAFVDFGLPLYSMGVVLITSVYVLIKRQRALVPLALFGFAAIIMFSLNSNLISVNRYAISVISQFIIIPYFSSINNKTWRKILVASFIIINLITCFIAYYGFITSEFVG